MNDLICDVTFDKEINGVSFKNRVLAGAVAGAVQCFINNPFEMIKIQLQGGIL